MTVQLNDERLIQSIRELFANSLQVPLEEIREDLSFGDIPQWDSLGHMEIMMRLEEHFGIEINAETIATLISLPAIYEYLKGDHHA